MFKSYLVSTTHQKILHYFIAHPEQSFYGAELSKNTKLSVGAVNKVLKDFHRDNILEKSNRGKTDFYSLVDNQPVIKQLKILSTLLILEPLIAELKPLTKQIILYGSASRGDNDAQSDIDLLIVATSADKTQAEEIIYNFQKNEDLPKMQAVIKTTAQWAGLEDKDPTYFHEVSKGTTLWDSLKDYESI